MKIELHEIPVREVAEGYVDSAGLWNAESGIAQPMMNGGFQIFSSNLLSAHRFGRNFGIICGYGRGLESQP